MRSLASLVLTLVLAASAPAWAVQTPRPGKADARVRTIDYDAQQVVRIAGVYRTATEILFAEDETILHVAVGDATAWDVVADKNILFIKPKAAHGLTNLIVTTSRGDGAARNYTFELTTEARLRASSLFVLRFHYPDDDKAAAMSALSIDEQALMAKLTDLKLDRGAIEGTRNQNYTVQGALALQPSEVSDNGRFTLMRFPAGQAIPAVYEVTPDGGETLIPFDVRGEFVVIHNTARQFRLRRGGDVLCIYNEAPVTYGADVATHTASPDIERTDVESGPAVKAERP